jgi:hypothetical protein
MLADILTKPLGRELFHTILKTILGNLPYSSNRGALRKMTTSKILTEAMGTLSCSDHGRTFKQKSGSTSKQKYLTDVGTDIQELLMKMRKKHRISTTHSCKELGK